LKGGRPTTVVCATKDASDGFFDHAYLGRSLRRIPESMRPAVHLYADNSGAAARGLGELYNDALDTLDSSQIAVFVHDDVFLNDWFIGARVNEGLQRFDVLGIAGSGNPDLRHPAWGQAFDADLNAIGVQPGLEASGAISQFDYLDPHPTYFGPTPLACRLLDGLLLAGHVGRWRHVGLRFDPQFRFHHYDLDLCRAAESVGLSIGTWPISVTHNSQGRRDTASFRDSATRYLEKWRS
jgi:hypothetical protein